MISAQKNMPPPSSSKGHKLRKYTRSPSKGAEHKISHGASGGHGTTVVSMEQYRILDVSFPRSCPTEIRKRERVRTHPETGMETDG